MVLLFLFRALVLRAQPGAVALPGPPVREVPLLKTH